MILDFKNIERGYARDFAETTIISNIEILYNDIFVIHEFKRSGGNYITLIKAYDNFYVMTTDYKFSDGQSTMRENVYEYDNYVYYVRNISSLKDDQDFINEINKFRRFINIEELKDEI